MSQWKEHFGKGIAAFRSGNLEAALASFSEAIKLGTQDSSVYDSRAAVYDKLGRTKEALLDCKQVIQSAPDRWQGYGRSARLFLKLGKYESALKMVDMAMERLRPDDSKRHAEFTSLKGEIMAAKEVAAERQRVILSKTYYHFGKLPVEIAHTIFDFALYEDPIQVVVFAQVCRNWRELILGTPSMWSTLVLSTRNPKRKAKLWSQRCRSKLASLHIRDGNSKTMYALEELQSIPLDWLRTLTLNTVNVEELCKSLPALNPTVVCNLETIELNELVAERGMLWFWSHGSMNLRVLRARNTLIDWPHIANHCIHLHTLSFSGGFDLPNLPDLLWLLQCNQQLETLELILWRPPAHLARFRCPPIQREIPQSIGMPHLTTLKLGGPALHISPMLRMLSLHKLEVLHLSLCTDTLDDALLYLVEQSAIPALKELKIDRSAVLSRTLISQVLQGATSLEYLELTSIDTIGPTLDALADPSSIICPKLTKLNVSRCPDVVNGRIMRIVKLRNDHTATPVATPPGETEVTPSSPEVARLLNLVIDGCPSVSREVLSWLRDKIPDVSCVYTTKKDARWKR